MAANVFYEKMIRTWELPTHISQFVLFSRASDFIHCVTRKSLCVSQSYRFYCETMEKWNTRNLFHEEIYEKSLQTLRVSHIFLLCTCFMAFSQIICSRANTFKIFLWCPNFFFDTLIFSWEPPQTAQTVHVARPWFKSLERVHQYVIWLDFKWLSFRFLYFLIIEMA